MKIAAIGRSKMVWGRLWMMGLTIWLAFFVTGNPKSQDTPQADTPVKSRLGDQEDWLGITEAFMAFTRTLTLIHSAYDVSHKEEIVCTRLKGACSELVIIKPFSETLCIDRFCPPVLGIPRFSPDGKRIAYLALVNDENDKSLSKKAGVYLYDLETGAKQCIYHGSARNILFTQDGRGIILECEKGVYVLSLKGDLLPTWAERIASYNLSSKGELIVEVSEPPYYIVTRWQELLSLSGKVSAFRRTNQHRLLRLISSASGKVAWSPDSKQFACIIQRGKYTSEVWLGNDTGKYTLLIRQIGGFIDNLCWSHKGDKLYFLTLTLIDRGYEPSLWSIDIRTGCATKLPYYMGGSTLSSRDPP